MAAKLSADAACSVLATEALALTSVASGKLGVELDFLLVNTLVDDVFFAALVAVTANKIKFYFWLYIYKRIIFFQKPLGCLK